MGEVNDGAVQAINALVMETYAELQDPSFIEGYGIALSRAHLVHHYFSEEEKDRSLVWAQAVLECADAYHNLSSAEAAATEAQALPTLLLSKLYLAVQHLPVPEQTHAVLSAMDLMIVLYGKSE